MGSAADRVEMVPCAACAQQVSLQARACPNCGQPGRAARRDRLITSTCVCLLLATIGYGYREVREVIASLKAGAHAIAEPRATELETLSTSNVDHATVTFTNVQGYTADSRCFAPVIKHKTNGRSTTGVVVCSGEIKPKTTVTITAPYEPGAVLEICGQDGRFGKTMDWSLCDFTLEKK